MSYSAKFPLRVPVIPVRQPLGNFYAAVLPASILRQVTYSKPLTIIKPSTGNKPVYPLDGTQRPESVTRHKEIGRFIDTTEAAFPNSIILAANYNQDGTQLLDRNDDRWRLNREANELIVPSSTPLATIVDGQHRLHGFEYSENPDRQDMPLLCSVYLDLPNAFQAYLFATVNFNQKKVPRSLAYELFGFNVEDEPPESWSPDKTAVLLCRKLNTDSGSPLRDRIIVAAEDELVLFAKKPVDPEWRVSTATIVDGILALISANPKRDRDELHKHEIGKGRLRSTLQGIKDRSPLRTLYLSTNDVALYAAVKNYFLVVSTMLWSKASDTSYITRTVGVQALCDVLKTILDGFETHRKISVPFFESELGAVSSIKFEDDFFQASGKGRVRLKNAMYIVMERMSLEDTPAADRDGYARVTKRR